MKKILMKALSVLVPLWGTSFLGSFLRWDDFHWYHIPYIVSIIILIITSAAIYDAIEKENV